MPRLPDCLSEFPTILGSSALITYGIVGLLQVWSAIEAPTPDNVQGRVRAYDPWRLRSGEVVSTSSIDLAGAKGRPAGDIPDERRLVRVVYPGLAGSR